MPDKITLNEIDIFLDPEVLGSSAKLEKIGERHYLLLNKNLRFNIEVLEENWDTVRIKLNGKEVSGYLQTEMAQMLESLGISNTVSDKVNELKAPMPGAILDLLCSVGQEVKKGDPLLILEAMKMENLIKSSGDGQIAEIRVNKGDNVEKNQILLRFK